MTRQRRAVLEALTTAGRPLSPAEILDLARTSVPQLNLATVYRNVKAMVERNQLAQVEVLGQPPRYEMADLPHHHHFLCEECDRLFDVEGCPGSMQKLAPPGFEVSDHELAMSGTCAECATG